MVQTKIKYLDILWYHRWFAITMFAIVLIVAAVVITRLDKEYATSAEIYLQPKSSAIGNETVLQNSDYRMINNQMEILTSDAVATEATEKIRHEMAAELKKEPRLTVSPAWLQGVIHAQKKDYTNIIVLSLQSPANNPANLARILKLYIDSYQEHLDQAAGKEDKFIEERMKVAQEELLASRDALTAFQSENQLYNIDQQINQGLTQAFQMDDQAKSVGAEIAALQRQISGTLRQLPANPEYMNLLARIERDSETSDLKSKIVNIEAERAEWSSKLTPQHPKMIAYERQLNTLRTLLRKRLSTFSGYGKNIGSPTVSSLDISLATDAINSQIKLDALRARESMLAAAHNEALSSLTNKPELAATYARLKSEFDTAQEKVRNLERHEDEVTMLKGVAKPQVDLLKQPAVPFSPVKPDAQRIMFVAFLLGLCLALFSVFIRATMDRTLHWPFQLKGMIAGDEDKTIFAMPAIAGRKEVTQLMEQSNFVVPESYKRLIIHLENLSRQQNVRRIGLIPVTPFADCNLTTVALSLYLTELSNKMVLIDTDFTQTSTTELVRSLRLPVSTAIAEGPGLSDYLSGDESVEDFIDIIYPLGKTVYGSMIPSGDALTHATGFQFSHRNLSQLEENLSPNYNFVLYGLPSVEQSYDAIAVARTLDGVFLLAAPGHTSLDQVANAVRELETVNCRVLGTIVQG